ncbi:hypothetical protein N7462_004272 [Penicillium macrosclerotiorum]|uniref:uncharacterized protein n=1 Tax=Penicillium macrosclerotiorum TaxID=303699 RepID=UPI00254970A1|nr:uncharacterized protein N7462_004272 [Penicillium macrosclerotiorum]KAJ5689880.1 hypothetical protein N7462_004272 [Penicillium macrosclerotiorum]
MADHYEIEGSKAWRLPGYEYLDDLDRHAPTSDDEAYYDDYPEEYTADYPGIDGRHSFSEVELPLKGDSQDRSSPLSTNESASYSWRPRPPVTPEEPFPAEGVRLDELPSSFLGLHLMNKHRGRSSESGPKTILTHTASRPDPVLSVSGKTAQSTNSWNADPPYPDHFAKSKWRAGMKSDAILGLSDFDIDNTERISLPNLFGRGPPRPGRTEVFEDLCRKTGAFIKPPAENDEKHLFIWGTPIQVSAAKKELKGLAAKYRQQSSANRSSELLPLNLKEIPKPHKTLINWAESSSYIPVEKAEYQEQHEKISRIRHLRERLLFPIYQARISPNILTFLLHDNGPTLNECFGQDLGELDAIREEFGVYVYMFDHKPDELHVAKNSDFNAKEITHRLREMWKRAMGNLDIRIAGYFMDLPSKEIARDTVCVTKMGMLHKPFLQGKKISTTPESQQIPFEDPFFARRLRMRIHFGTFVLHRYMAPKTNKYTYGLEEFGAMVHSDNTRGRIVPGLKITQAELFSRLQKAEELIESLDPSISLNSLAEMEPTLSVGFEFSSKADTILHLEIDFAKASGSHEIEVSGRRWLKTSGGDDKTCRMPLQLAMIDFAKTDWQCDIEFFEAVDGKDVKKTQREFASSVRFIGTKIAGYLDSHPEKRTSFPNDAPITRYVERTALNFQVKGTSLILEVIRFDEYRLLSVPGKKTTSSPNISWGAVLFNPEWDIILEEDAEPDAHSIAQKRGGLKCFFPSTQDAGVREDAGFQELLQIVDKIGCLLGGPEVEMTEQARTTRVAGLLEGDVGSLF